MEEKERYKWSQDVIVECLYEDYDYIVDTENNIIFSDDNYFKLVDLLNQQDKRIKELEQENLSLQEQSIRDNQNWIEETTQLKQQLAIIEKALELAYEFNATTTCSGHCLDCCHKEICDSIDDLNKKQSNYIYYFKNKAKEMLENE